MTAEAIIKSQARQILKNNFVPSIIALLILLLPFVIIDGATTVFSCVIIKTVADESLAEFLIYCIGDSFEIIAGILLSPLINGYVRAHYRAAYTKEIDLKDVFYYAAGSGHYFDALSINIRLIIRMLLPILLLFSPVFIFDVIAMLSSKEFTDTLLYYDVHFFLCLLSTTTTILYSLRYYTVLTVSADNPQFSAKQVFRYNKKIMKDNTNSAAKLLLSFIPWFLLCFLALPMLYVIPYLTQSLCVSAKWLTKTALEEHEP